ncbi:tetratricopeptide repeat protein [Nocardia sp. NPDC055053]
MTEEFEAEWRIWASGLVPVRDLARKQRRGCTAEEERAAWVKVARAPAFHGLGPTTQPTDRGRWIAARIQQRLILVAESVSDRESAAGRAIRCWAHYVEDGLTPAQLYRDHPELFVQEPTTSTTAQRQRVQALMWAGGARGDKDSLAGLRLVVAELRSALSTELPGGTVMDAVTFDYEWRRLAGRAPAARDLLQALARLAPAQPFPLGMLREAGDCLPGLAGDLCTRPADLRATIRALRDRGLLVQADDAVYVPESVRPLVTARVTERQGPHWTAAVLRFLTHALPPATHDPATWPQWDPARAHVLAVCATALDERVGLGDVVYLLDRASVHAREALEDVTSATELAERAVRTSTESGCGDPALHADALGNLALAHRNAGRTTEAVTVSEQGLALLEKTLGNDSEDYAESLNVHGGLLAFAGRRDESEQAHERAIAILRELGGANPAASTRGLLVEALNDYAVRVLAGGTEDESARPARVERARESLREASRLTSRHEYGWARTELNLALADREADDDASARTRLEAIRAYCREHMPGPSTLLVTTLRLLAQLYEDTGHPAARETLRAAHRLDNELAFSGDPAEIGRSS